MEVLTVVFSHWEWEFLKPFYEWNKARVPELKYIWDISDMDPQKISEIDNPDFMPMKLNNLWANVSNYFSNCINWFQRESPEFFVLMEADAIVGTDDFVQKSIDYMKIHKIHVLFPWLKDGWSYPEHPFAKSLRTLQGKHWTIPGLTIIHRSALGFYGQSMNDIPQYWNEIRFPTVLCDAGFHIAANPYTHETVVHTAEGNKEERKNKSLTREEIKNGLENGYKAFHPIKDPSLLDYITELLNEKKNTKEEVSEQAQDNRNSEGE